MRTPRAIIRQIPRLAVVAVVTAAVIGVGPAQGRPGGTATMPHLRQTVSVPASDPPAPAPRGMATAGRSGASQSQEGLPTVNAVTHSCPGTSRDATRLGLMEHTAMYSHCDYP
jgi:hypothetical protein